MRKLVSFINERLAIINSRLSKRFDLITRTKLTYEWASWENLIEFNRPRCLSFSKSGLRVHCESKMSIGHVEKGMHN